MGSDRPTAMVIRTAGTNCEAELVRAFELAGAQAELVHVRRLMEDPTALNDADLIGLPGGFSHGDDIAAGRAMSVLVERHLRGRLEEAVGRGVPVIGICNGFQVLVQTGLLPGGDLGRCLALDVNAGGRFVDRWVGMEVSGAERSVWTRGLPQVGFEYPMAHGEGRLVAIDAAVIDTIESDGAVLRYAENVNGSVANVAGLSDPSGLVFGLMPHPERFLTWRHHPAGVGTGGETPGLAIFRSAVDHVVAAAVA